MNKNTRLLIGIIAAIAVLVIAFLLWRIEPVPPGPVAENGAREHEANQTAPALVSDQDDPDGSQADADVQPAADAQASSDGSSPSAVASQITITPSEPIFEIARDYNQRVILGVKNDGQEDVRVKVRREPFAEGLLGDFVGVGSDEEPLTVPAGKQVDLSLYLFAQDANRPAYHTNIEVVDAQSGASLASAPVNILLPLPKFDVEATLGDAEPGTLAIPVTSHNQGQALTDLEVAPDASLLGRVAIQPIVHHAYLRAGESLEFRVVPRLTPGFTELEGDILVRAAGQSTKVRLHFTLPEGKQIFVANAFCTWRYNGSSWYCTNRPNISTPLGGPLSDLFPPFFGGDSSNDDSDSDKEEGEDSEQGSKSTGWPGDFFRGIVHPSANEDALDNGDWETQLFGIGPYDASIRWGDAPGVSGPPPSGYRNLNGKTPLGISEPDGQPGASSQTAPPNNSSTSNGADAPGTNTPPTGNKSGTPSSGSQLSDPNSIPQSSPPPPSEMPRTDDPRQVQWETAAGNHHGPRGGTLREAYKTYRPHTLGDNAPEAMLSYSRGNAGQRSILQAWHSNGYGKSGRQVLFRTWDGFGQAPRTKKVALCKPGHYGRWPSVLAMPENRALVVWEQAPKRNARPSLVYRVSGPNYDTWTDIKSVPGSQADHEQGDYVPVTALAPNGRVLLTWQRGTGADSRIFVTRSNAAGEFDEPTTPDKFPTGGKGPIPRFAADGTLYLAFQAPAEGANDQRSAVFVAVSHDLGRSFESVQQVSGPDETAGEPDLLVAHDEVHVVYREGETWASRIMHTVRALDASEWTPGTAVSPAKLYAEYPSLVPLKDGVRVEFYGAPRENVADLTVGSELPSVKTMIKRYQVTLRDGETSSPQRLLTRYPTTYASWLQINFRLRTERWKYRPHELTVLLNGEELFSQENIIPQGTFLLPVNTALLRSDHNGVPQNNIEIRTRHMNRAHYSTATNFRLETRHSFIEKLVVASSQEEADRLLAAETDAINHTRHDVGLFAKLPLEELPTRPKPGEVISVPLFVCNLGESAAKDVRIEVFDTPPASGGSAEGEPITEPMELGTLEPLKDFQRRTVEFPFGDQDTYYIAIRAAGEDFDPDNNVHVVSFVTPEPEPLAPKTYADQELAVILADHHLPPYRCRFLNEAGEEVAVAYHGKLEGELPSGTYHVAIQRFERNGKEVVFPERFEYSEGEPLIIRLESAVELILPEEIGDLDLWQLVSADDPENIIDWRDNGFPMMHVPPGEYQVAFKPRTGLVARGYVAGRRIVWPETFKVESGKITTARLSGLLTLELPEQMNDIQAWRVYAVHDLDEPIQAFSHRMAGRRVMLLPPGEYQVAFEPRIGLAARGVDASKRIIWPEIFKVESGKITTARLSGLLKLELPEQVNDMHAWSVYAVGNLDEPIQAFSYGMAKRRVMLLPPGEYRVAIQSTEDESSHLLWPETFSVEPSKTTTARLNGLLKVELPEEVGHIHKWMIHAADNPDKVVRTFDNQLADRGVMLLPPGEYQISFKPTMYHSKPIVWPETFEVRSEEVTTARLSGLLQLELPEQVGKIESWSAAPVDQPDKPIQHFSAGSDLRVMLLPPGEYQIAFKPTLYHSKSIVWPETLTVESGKKALANLTSGVRVNVKTDAKPKLAVRIVADDKVIQSSTELWDAYVVPPGIYRVEVRPAGEKQWQALSEKLEVKSGEITDLSYPAAKDR